MVFRVYNQNGKVKITKTMSYLEQVMFSDLQDGEVVEIEVGSSLWTKSHTKKAGTPVKEEPSSMETATEGLNNLMKSVQTLEFARANGILDPVEADNAILILKNSVYGACAGK